MNKDTLQIRIWGAAVLLLAMAELYFDWTESQIGVFMTKPATMIVILLHPAVIGIGLANPYQKGILLGLMASVLGDVMLMVPGNFFLYGLGAFLVAHVLYATVFFREMEERPDWKTGIPYYATGLAAFAVIAGYGDVDTVLMAPVFVYTMAIMTMAWLAQARLNGLSNGRLQAARYAYVGALLFVVSDLTLAVNRFVVPFEGAQLVVMSTYFSAQYLIARSAIVFPRKRF